MSIPTNVIEHRQAQRILSGREDNFNDKKSRSCKPAKLPKHISALANADGGELFVGVEEHDDAFVWNGFADEEDGNGHIQFLTEHYPPSSDYHYEFLECPEKPGLVLHIVVQRSSNIVKAVDGNVYRRMGASSQPVNTPEKLERLKLDKGIISFETNLIGDDPTIITESSTTEKFLEDSGMESSAQEWMTRQCVIRENKPTVSGLLLYADLPQAVLAKSAVKVYRYRGTDEEGGRDQLVADPVTIEGPLYTQIARAVEKTKEMVQEAKVMRSTGLTEARYPDETLHEILTNAVIHRDYSIHDDVHVRIFDNRVEVESPGQMAGHVTPSNALKSRFARNGQIVRLLNKFPSPPNKDVGEGLRTAFKAMQEMNLKTPKIVEKESSVLVIIKHEKLGSLESQILDYLRNHESITNRIVREISGEGSENKVTKAFRRLQDSNQIEIIPGKRGNATAYRLKQI